MHTANAEHSKSEIVGNIPAQLDGMGLCLSNILRSFFGCVETFLRMKLGHKCNYNEAKFSVLDCSQESQ